MSDADREGALPSGVLPLWAVFGFTLGVLAPSTTLALAIGVVAKTAGTLTWLTWAVTGAIMLGFAGAISWIACRIAGTGGLYALASRAGGRVGGFFVLATQVSAILVAGPACALGSAIYLSAWLDRLGVPHGRAVLTLLCVLVILTIGAMCLCRIKISARVLLVIELLTIGVIFVLLAVVLLSRPGTVVDARQFQSPGGGLSAVLATAGFAAFSMAGFEQAATLGREARNAKRAIAVAMIGSMLFITALYVVASYIIVLGLEGVSVPGHSTPLDALAAAHDISWLGHAIDLGVGVSFFGCTLGVMAGTARTLYTLAGDGVLPRPLARVDTQRGTPVTAVLFLTALYLTIGIPGALAADAHSAYSYLGTLAGYLLVTAYGVTTVAAGVHAVRTRSLAAGIVVCVLVGTAGLVLLYDSSFRPLPSGAYRIVAAVFLGLALLSALGYLALRTLRPEVLDRIGQSQRQEP